MRVWGPVGLWAWVCGVGGGGRAGMWVRAWGAGRECGWGVRVGWAGGAVGGALWLCVHVVWGGRGGVMPVCVPACVHARAIDKQCL